ETEKFGYSPALVEKTILDAADRVERLPVRDVFDWARLRMLWVWCAVVTVGVYLFVGVVSCVVGAFTGGSASPFDFMGRLNDVAGIWAERNLLLQNSYWPRNAYLQFVSFQDSPEHPGEMRVPRDQKRDDVIVRAIHWVVADSKSPDGWRPLYWRDLDRFMSK